ncbi:MAG: hypothetical protein JSS66_05380 [Armatimonadetes bacterium]|nr:hypothetical protein [Armatimonadota bacterium]
MASTNNVRGQQALETKIAAALELAGRSNTFIDTVLETTMSKFGDTVGIMPVAGCVPVKALLTAVLDAVNGCGTPEEAAQSVRRLEPAELMVSDSVAPIRLDDSDVRSTGQESESILEGAAVDIDVAIRDIVGSPGTEVFAYEKDGETKVIEVESIDMVDYMEDDDLTDEGRRARGFLPATYDSMDALTPEAQVDVAQRNIGSYGYDNDGELFISCPQCHTQDVVPVGAGTYMCLECEDFTFDVDLLLNDLLPEDEVD